MYIAPNTEIRLLSGVPLDNTYAHTIYFTSKESQAEYFAGKTLPNGLLTQQSYQRYAKGTLRINRLADDIYNANYMMFRNTSFGNRWFYAFVNNIEYVSNTVCEIEYEIDVIQTWFFDVTLLQSFVEREHSATDVAGENIVPEPVNIGEYYMGDPVGSGLFNTFDVVIVSPYTYVYNEPVQPWTAIENKKEIDGIVTILAYTAFDSTNDETDVPNVSFLAKALNQFPDNDDIACAYLLPHSMVDYPYGEQCTRIDTDNFDSLRVPYFQHHPTTLSHGYAPKNKKLLTFPYNKLVIDTADGNLSEYAFEFFDEYQEGSSHIDSIAFEVRGYRGINCSFRAVPIHYKGESLNYTEGCLLTDFPNVGIITDSFKAWVAQNKTRTALQLATDAIGVSSGAGTVMAGSQIMTPITNVLSKAGAKMMATGYEQIGKSGVKDIGGTLAEFADRSRLRYHPKVGSNDGSQEIVWGKKDFTGIQYSVNPLNAKIIDDFFNCYGYATHLVKVPNRNVRPHWTYVKTIDINLESNAPADDTNKIASIYDHGITFWKNPSEVGNYSLDNSPV